MVAADAVAWLAQQHSMATAAWLLAISGVLGTLLLLNAAGHACSWLLSVPGLDHLALRSTGWLCGAEHDGPRRDRHVAG